MLRQAVVFGANGALGKAIVADLKKRGVTTIGVDIRESQADSSVVMATSGSFEANGSAVVESIKSQAKNVVAVISVAGGWAGGSIADKSVFANTDLMFSQSVQSSVLAGHVAAQTLQPNGVLVLTGAAAAAGPTPGMVAYGLNKAAVHQLVGSLAHKDSGLPAGTTVCAILPTTLDTPANRAGMPTANFDDWTPLDHIASKIGAWADAQDRPSSGSLLKIETKAKATTWTRL
eukprot:TRINITY_DN1538_c0_g1_i1.p1 TRINITY_DN1538_c0_g1~~TRINITY_DN1538_c0_g1_i1.p1  ORF type:complete len:232 (-),score=56.94 TRINITY_DN1538_c0_g1_i1:54-749(-)